MSLKVLITGGAGFIGTHLLKRLIAENKYKIFVVDNLSAVAKTRFPRQVKFYRSAIQDPSLGKIFQQVKPQIVFHLAADNRIISSASEIISSNVIGTFNILHQAKLAKVKQVIFTSSAAVYGESKKFPIQENFPTKPISAYGLSKLTGELYCQLFQKHFPVTIFRFANVYGPGQNSSSEGGVVAIFIRKFLENKTPIIYDTGKQIRDFIYVDDVVDALILALEKPQSTTLNIGSSQPTSILKLLKLTAKLIGRPVNYISKPKRPVEIGKSLFSHELAVKKLNWHPKTDLADGLEQTIKYFKSL